MEFFISLFFSHIYHNPGLQNEVSLTFINHSKSQASSFRFRNYKDNGLTPPNFTFKSLLEKVKPSRILDLFKLLLFEKKIIIVSSEYDENAIIIESLLSLIYPL